VKLVFDIHLNAKHVETLYLIQRFFGVGNVYLYKDKAHYLVQKLSDLVFIIEHFTKYPLKTKKYADFILFTKAFDILKTPGRTPRCHPGTARATKKHLSGLNLYKSYT